MKFRIAKTPKFVTWFFPNRIWAFSRKEPTVYLTFDDGPIPEVTPWVLKTLKNYNAKATFFCIGENIEKHPTIFQQIINEGHSIGNHTQNHVKGTVTDLPSYLKNVEAFENSAQISTTLFRPPYGKITNRQAKEIEKKGYKLVMWDVLSYDWEASVSSKKCFENVASHVKKGSVVVFHDSLKAERNLKEVLPQVLELIKKNNWKSDRIEMR